jgi:hypothetical protein
LIYFIADALTGRVKIGYSGNPVARFSKIRADSSGDLTLLAVIDGDMEAERALHERFVDFAVRGEWFRHEGALGEYIGGLPQFQTDRSTKTMAFWNGMSAEAVSRSLGVSKAHLSKIRSGGRGASPELAIKLQRLTGVSAIKLVFGELADEAA